MEDNKENGNNTSSSSSLSLLFGPNTPPKSNYFHNQIFEENFTSMYHSIFPPKSPLSLSPSSSSTTSSSSSAAAAAAATEHRLNHARLILEYQQLCDHHDLCLSRLRSLSAEIETLRRENAGLRRANAELVRLLGVASSRANNVQRCFFSDMNQTNNEDVYDISPTSVMDNNRFVSRNHGENLSIPKSISVRSGGYFRNKTHATPNSSSRTTAGRRSRAASPDDDASLILKEKIEKEEDVEVFMQGMFKTELCNKWEETGACPYGDRCRFAHGIGELRPVIRHPRYKTELCRMILGGGSCPYGHRCHFRHALSEHEKLMLFR